MKIKLINKDPYQFTSHLIDFTNYKCSFPKWLGMPAISAVKGEIFPYLLDWPTQPLITHNRDGDI